MTLLKKLKDNRLKIVSVMAVSADILMGLSGGVSMLFWSDTDKVSDLCLMTASGLAIFGHVGLLLWGKGGKVKTDTRNAVQEDLPAVWLRPFTPWHYPLDWAFFLFVSAGFVYALAGLAAGNIPLFIKGCLVACASALGWLWPQDRALLGMPSMKVTALLYATASVSTFFASFIAQNIFMFAAGCVYICMNAILYTVRKENQSVFTQNREAVK